MLERFRQAKQAEIARLLAAGPPPPLPGPRPGFRSGLEARGPCAVVAEYKRASPSKGVINLGLEPRDVAAMYARAGAAAVSVLTEEAYFQGSLAYLAAMTGPGLPLLRKDFLFHPLQVAETAATPASALLLIARMFATAQELRDLREQAESLGLEALVEVFDEQDLDLARESGATLLQVNNRDLDTLAVSLDVSRRLAPQRRAGEFWISASGIDASGQVAEMRALGFGAVLVGTSLMASADPGAALAALVAGGRP
ncbi:MAG TPA: indole-3-glycerol phosphate synthase [Desulfovibrio sp.]|nr:indole-3-glycerol phosphate synthase [Desulfovibrio sp.]